MNFSNHDHRARGVMAMDSSFGYLLEGRESWRNFVDI